MNIEETIQLMKRHGVRKLKTAELEIELFEGATEPETSMLLQPEMTEVEKEAKELNDLLFSTSFFENPDLPSDPV